MPAIRSAISEPPSSLIASQPAFEPVSSGGFYHVDRLFFPLLQGVGHALFRRRRIMRRWVKALLYPLGLLRTWRTLRDEPPGILHLQWAPMPVLDALLDCPMEEAVAELPLADNIKRALVEGSGPIGQALRCAIAYERADWDDVQFYGLAPAPIREKYLEAIAWTRHLSSGLLN